MNSVLFSLAVAVVAVLCAAMFGPYFIDWNGYRGIVEAELGDAIGQPVYIDGDLEVRLLPTPYIQAGELGVRSRTSQGGIPLVSAPNMRATIALAPMLRGEFKVTELSFDRPVIQAFWNEDGTLEMPGLPDAGQVPLAPEHVSLETIEIRDGSIVLRDDQLAEIKTLTQVNLTGEAGSLSGPFKAEGGLLVDGEIHAFKISTGRVLEDGSVKIKATLRPAGGLYELALDGDFGMPERRPVYLGKVRLTGGEGTDLAWRLSADVAAEPEKIAASALELGLGAPDRAVNLTGNALLDLGRERHAKLVIGAKQIDIDRALGKTAGEKASVAAGLALIRQTLGRVALLPFPVNLDASVDAVVVNGGLMEEIALTVELERDRIDIERLVMRLPGKTQVSGRGVIDDPHAIDSWSGSLSVSTHQAAQLTDWLGSEALAWGPVRAKPGASEISLQADIRRSGASISLSDMALSIDQSTMTGSLAFESAEKTSLDLNVDVRQFDFDRYFALASDEGAADPGAIMAEIDQATVRLRAEELVLGGIVTREVIADVAYENGAVSVTSLSAGDLGGAAVSLEGRIDNMRGAASGQMRAAINADDLTGMARLLADTGVIGSLLTPDREQLSAMAPASLNLLLSAAPDGAGTAATLRAEGVLAATRLRADANFLGKIGERAGSTLKLSVDASNPQADVLLRQIGLDANRIDLLETGVNPAGSIVLTSDNALATDALLNLDVRMVDTALAFDGVGGLDAGRPVLKGEMTLNSADIRPALSLFSLPDGGREGPIDISLSAGASFAQGAMAFEDLRAITRGTTFAGAVRVEAPDAGRTLPRVTGTLDLDAIDPKPLLALFLGDDSFATDTAGLDAAWPEAPFDMRRIGLLEGEVAIAARRAELPALGTTGETRFVLAMDAAGLELRDISVAFAGGSMTGRLAVTRSETGAALQAAVGLSDLALERVVWARGGIAVARGTGSASFQVSGAGRSVLGLISSLDGEGSFQVRDGTLQGLEPSAFARIVAAADSGLDLATPKVLQVFRGFLAAGSLDFDGFDGLVAINNGVAVVRNAALDTKAADVRISALFDLHEFSMKSEWQLAPPVSPDTAAAIPPVVVLFSGPLERPVRRLDVAALTGFLTVRRLEQDVKRLEEAQADALERGRFDREVRLLTQERLKRIRAARVRAEEEAARRASEEERLRFEEEEQRPAPENGAFSGPRPTEDLPQGIAGAAVHSVGVSGDAPDRSGLDAIVTEALQEPLSSPPTSVGRQAAPRNVAPPLDISPRATTQAPASAPAPRRYRPRSDPSTPILPQY